mmetsp:Transcript_31967/g.90763  ORF Transcript_31967/g.90763 Transcript_31967/m.90763 type:complete len:299 (-) Transcript_31967:38-934(-)
MSAFSVVNLPKSKIPRMVSVPDSSACCTACSTTWTHSLMLSSIGVAPVTCLSTRTRTTGCLYASTLCSSSALRVLASAATISSVISSTPNSVRHFIILFSLSTVSSTSNERSLRNHLQVFVDGAPYWLCFIRSSTCRRASTSRAEPVHSAFRKPGTTGADAEALQMWAVFSGRARRAGGNSFPNPVGHCRKFGWCTAPQPTVQERCAAALRGLAALIPSWPLLKVDIALVLILIAGTSVSRATVCQGTIASYRETAVDGNVRNLMSAGCFWITLSCSCRVLTEGVQPSSSEHDQLFIN